MEPTPSSPALSQPNAETKKFFSNIVLIGTAASFLLIGAAVAYFCFPPKGNFGIGGKSEKMEVPFTAYYAVQGDPSDDSGRGRFNYQVFKMSPRSEEPDLLLHTMTGLDNDSKILQDSGKKDTLIYLSNSQTQARIFEANLKAVSDPVLIATIPLDQAKGQRVSAVRFVEGGAALAIIVSEYRAENAENSELRIISASDQSIKETYKLSEKSPLYAGFGFLAATPDDKTFYLHETGGDGGAMWQSWYAVDRTAKTVRKLEGLPVFSKLEDRPVPSYFSPDRTRLAYADFSDAIDPQDFGNYETGYMASCIKSGSDLTKYQSFGGTIMLRDMANGSTTEVWRNVKYEDNYCKNIGTRIISLVWLDDSGIAFNTIDGIYSLDISTKEVKTLFLFEDVVSPGTQGRAPLLSVQLPYILLGDGTLIHTESKKSVMPALPTGTQPRFFSF